METIPWNTGNKIESHLGITRLNTRQTLIMLCSKDKRKHLKGRNHRAEDGRATLLALSFIPFKKQANVTHKATMGLQVN